MKSLQDCNFGQSLQLIQEHSTHIGEAKEDEVTSLQWSVKVIEEHIENPENRSRRDNTQIVGLEDAAKGKQLTQFSESWLPRILGLWTEDGRVKIDSPSIRNKMDHSLSPLSLKCHEEKMNFIHLCWLCKYISGFWNSKELGGIFKIESKKDSAGSDDTSLSGT